MSRPTDVSALAGDDILLSCQATGDPHPDIHWTRKDADRVDINKVGIPHINLSIAGKGRWGETRRHLAPTTQAAARASKSLSQTS